MLIDTNALLPPMRYALFMPHRGVYVKAMQATEGAFEATCASADACAFPDPEARAAGRLVIRATGEPVELRLASGTGERAAV